MLALSSRTQEHTTVTLAPQPESAGRARRIVNDILNACGLEHLSPVAELLTSELVTNAAQHARSPIGLSVRATAEGLRVEVRDRSPRVPLLVLASADSTGGRGLAIVDTLADSWGVTPLPDGKSVWFALS